MSESDKLPSLVALMPGKFPNEVNKDIKRLGGMDRAAAHWLQELGKVKGKKVAAFKWHAYSLLASCVHANEAPPPNLMRLLFECLQLQEGAPPKEVCTRYKWPHPKKPHQMSLVLDADAKSMFETRKPMSTHALWKITGVSRKDIDRYRSHHNYEKRRFKLEMRLLASIRTEE